MDRGSFVAVSAMNMSWSWIVAISPSSNSVLCADSLGLVSIVVFVEGGGIASFEDVYVAGAFVVGVVVECSLGR